MSAVLTAELVVARNVSKGRQRILQHLADSSLPKFKTMFLNSVRLSRRQIVDTDVHAAWVARDRARLHTSTFGLIDDWARRLDMESLFLVLLGRSAAAIELKVPKFPLRTAISFAPTVILRFDKTNPKAVAWAKAHAAELVTNVTNESKQAINSVVTKLLQGNVPAAHATSLIKQSIGLTERQGDAVVNLYQRMITSPGRNVAMGARTIRVPMNPTDEYLDRIVSRYADHLLLNRADTISRTETMEAVNEGQVQLWSQAIESGQLSADAEKVWISSNNCCDECEAVDNESVPVNEDFSVGDDPPLHVNCRCTVGLKP